MNHHFIRAWATDSGALFNIQAKMHGIRSVCMYPQNTAAISTTGGNGLSARQNPASGSVQTERRIIMHTAQAIGPHLSRTADIIKAARKAQAAQIEQARKAVQEFIRLAAEQAAVAAEVKRMVGALQAARTVLTGHTTQSVLSLQAQATVKDEAVSRLL